MSHTIPHLLIAAAAQRGDADAIRAPAGAIGWTALLQDVRQAAGWLAARGIGAGLVLHFGRALGEFGATIVVAACLFVFWRERLAGRRALGPGG